MYVAEPRLYVDMAVHAAKMRVRNQNAPYSLSMVYVSPIYASLRFKNVVGDIIVLKIAIWPPNDHPIVWVIMRWSWPISKVIVPYSFILKRTYCKMN